ncbi:G-D-S-L family lipolytic protein [Pseudodesulfovibrio sp. F-1]|uniref:G-D-S-L family lipolytic protein n=1 Tax=Pseudodesulfovibrio alkaliphilus TaxID=2661613 RepID=A0A7K1KJY7_9BACT|nr:GDSL-type esterase/lipase family protein [Pseudodesulfovibrio alkaliphilus]MUM76369.1 G-D-S-L family lipolytic protein [Pseudodesulfovibrio alkaliphilus]
MVICYFGDSLTLGVGDEAGMGWPGRLGVALRREGVEATAYNLGVRRDATVRMQHRWRAETMVRRMENTPLRLVFNFGVADVFNNIGTEESLGAAVAMLTRAKAEAEVLVIGPTPVNDRNKREAIAGLSRLFQSMCQRLDIPFVPAIDAMHRSFVYGQALNDGDGVHPAGAGYADLAEHILKHDAARAFFGLK